MATVRRFGGLIACLLGLAACQPCKAPVAPPDTISPDPTPAPTTNEARFDLRPIRFSDLEFWSSVDLEASAAALQKSCDSFKKRDPKSSLSGSAPYAGLISDWLPACSVLPKYREAQELKRFYEDYFTPSLILTDEETNKLTGYYEPELTVSATPTKSKSAPIPLRPKDMVEVRLGQFDPGLEGKTVWGQIRNGKLELYPARSDIRITSDRVIAYADPADVFFLQIQGSGRLRFPDGRVIRAGFDSHNHRPFGSLANHLIKTGEIERSEASMQGIRRWMDRVGLDKARAAMNVNPRFVFFRQQDITNPEDGPTGASGLALTALGSMAVDLSVHAMGVPFYVETNLPNPDKGTSKAGLVLISQDTGGAIKGVQRGDIFFGWGDAAGGRAGRMNDAGRFVVFLPQEISP